MRIVSHSVVVSGSELLEELVVVVVVVLLEPNSVYPAGAIFFGGQVLT